MRAAPHRIRSVSPRAEDRLRSVIIALPDRDGRLARIGIEPAAADPGGIDILDGEIETPASRDGKRGGDLVRRDGFASILERRALCLLLVATAAVHLTLPAFGLSGWQCPLHETTGLPCPGCGLSRALVALGTGDWSTALGLHAFAPIALLVLVLVATSTVLPERPRAALVHRVRAIENRTLLPTVLAVGLIVYWVVRLIGAHDGTVPPSS